MTFRAVSCNAHRPGTAANNRETIFTARKRADVLGVQEGADAAIIGAMTAPGWAKYVPFGAAGTNPIAWRTALFDLVDKGWAKIFDNKAGVADGPDRFLSWVLLREKSTGKFFYFVNVHLIHQAFTSHPERKPSWTESVANVAKFVATLLSIRPNVPVVMCGDWNAPGVINFPGLNEREVASPPTFGSRRYDRFFLIGNVKVIDGPDADVLPDGEDFATPSDHDSLFVKLSLGAPTPPPAPKPEVRNGICPFAVKKLIAPGDNDPRITPRLAILHVDATNAFSLFSFFKFRSGGIESHFHIRKDGVIEQYRNIYWEADANYKANPFAVSIETQGFGLGWWNTKQKASIKRLLLWLHDEAEIPLRVPPAWDKGGVGYHVQFGAPGKWTPVAKSCPGRNRIRQYNRWLVPWLKKVP